VAGVSGLSTRVGRLEAAAAEALLRQLAAEYGLGVDEVRAETYRIAGWQLAGLSERDVIERIAAEHGLDPDGLRRKLEVFRSRGADLARAVGAHSGTIAVT
jgi:hypothetical protein